MTACASSAAAHFVCNTREAVLETLATNYNEEPIAVGVTNSGGLIEVLTDSDGKTWTIIMTSPQGNSCLVVAGENWRDRRPRPEGMAP